jgi:hypothetical protein
MTMLAEVIASAFASGFSWRGDANGKPVYCAEPNVKGHQIMSAFEDGRGALWSRDGGDAETGLSMRRPMTGRSA